MGAEGPFDFMSAGLRWIYSLAFWAFMLVSSLVLYPVAVVVWAVTAPFDRRRAILHQFTCFWASLYTWFNPAWRVSIRGRERIDASRPCVMVANHLSLVDIPVLFRLFTHFKWVSKIENFRVPLIGWNMSLNRYVKLVRGNHASTRKMFRECEDRLAEGSSVMMFPEGTRSVTGRMRAFKSGAFRLALTARCPIQPIALLGTADALPKRGFVLQGRHDVEVCVLEPLPYESFAHMDAEELTQHVRSLIATEIEARRKLRDARRGNAVAAG